MVKSFPAKILLLGEYTILNGSKALALPYGAFSGQWSFAESDSETSEQSRKSLMAFKHHPCSEYIDLQRFAADVDRGLWFESSIPQGYGVGSSGALIAAILDSYALKEEELDEAKFSLARLEDYFHGSSSGLDPLVSYVQRPVLIHSFNQVEVLEKKMNLKKFFLLNTGRPRQTGPLVNTYKEKLKDSQFKQSCANVLSKEVNFAIEAIVDDRPDNLFHHLWLISKFQWDFFPEMIPTQMRGLWSGGLEGGDYVLKLCGAGGGGFLLGYSEKHDLAGMKSIISEYELTGLF